MARSTSRVTADETGCLALDIAPSPAGIGRDRRGATTAALAELGGLGFGWQRWHR